MKKIGRFLFSRSGATPVEYAMVAAVISVMIITGAASLGSAMNAKFQMVGNSVSAAP